VRDGATAEGTKPLVSVVMANFRSAEYLPAALDSVLAQTVRNLEVIVSDDASPDDSIEIVRQYTARDPRVRLIAAEENKGPAAARNRGIDAARGEWIAIVDSDDIVHPERLEILIAAAEGLEADGVADDLLFFSNYSAGPTLLGDAAVPEPLLITPSYFIRSNTSGNGLPPLGYVKPLFRRAKLAGLSYDEDVRIGEDYDFLLRFLLSGARFHILPDPLYLYRRHSQSISHRLSESTVLAMITNQQRLVATHGTFSPEMENLLEKRVAALRSSLSFERLVLSLKERRAGKAFGLLAANPGLLRPLTRAVKENLQSCFQKKPVTERAQRVIALYDENRLPQDVAAIHSALGVDENIELVPAPPYEQPATRGTPNAQQRTGHLNLAARAMEWDLEVVCHGLAGLHAAGYLPRKRIVATVVQEREELARILDRPDTGGNRIVVAAAALEAASTFQAQPFCPGYLLVEPTNGRTPPVGVTRAAEGT